MEKINLLNILSLLFMLVLCYLISTRFIGKLRANKFIESFLFSIIFISGILACYFVGNISIHYVSAISMGLIGLYGGGMAVLVSILLGAPLFVLLFYNGLSYINLLFLLAPTLGVIQNFLVNAKKIRQHWGTLLLYSFVIHAVFILSTITQDTFDITRNFSSFAVFNTVSAVIVFAFALILLRSNDSVNEKLKFTEEKYNYLLDRISGAVIKIDYLGRITYANKYLLSLLNVPFQDIKGKQVVGLIFNKTCDAAMKMIRNVSDFSSHKCPCRFESELVSSDGKKFWLSWDCKVADESEDNIYEILFTGIDITEWKKNEWLQSTLEQRIELLHGGMLDSYARVSIDGKIVEFNEAFLELTGYAKEELLGLSYNDLTPGKWHLLEKSIIDNQVFSKGYSDLYEKEYLKKDGNIVPVELRTYLVKNKIGEFDGFWALIRDVSHRKDVERKLSYSESLYRNIVEKSPLPIFFVELDTENQPYVKKFNNAAKQFLGLRQDLHQDRLFNEALPFLCKNDLPSKLTKAALDGSDVFVDQFSFIKEKEQVYVEIRAFQVEPLKVVLILFDISQRIMDREELELSEKKFRTVITENPMVFFMFDKNGVFTLSEGQGLAKLGLKPGQVVGLSVFDVYKDFPDIVECSKKSLTGESVKTGIQVGDIYYDTFFTPIFDSDSKVKSVLGVAYDITSRVNAEKEVVQKSEELELYFNNSLDLLCIADMQGCFRKVNPEWSKLLGYTPEELEGKKFLDFIHPDDIESTNFAIKELSDRGKILNFTNRYIRKQGDYRWIEWRSFMDGSLIYSVARDITERKIVEEKILENDRLLQEQNEEYVAMNEELSESNQRIREINEKLIEATEKAQESDRLKSAFLANMSHEIRTPMNGIVGFCQLLKQTNSADEQVKKYCDIIYGSSNQLLSIINDIIDISKIEAGQVTLSHEPVSINNLVDRTVGLFQVMASQNNVVIRKFLSSAYAITILSDETKISQVLSNLINNAIKFSKNGEVDVGVSEKNKHIEIWVKDTGIGIAPENHRIIFDRFRQVDGANPNSMKGTGLGLAISKSLVEMLGGEIWVNSDIGKGATFTFTIPNIRAMEGFESVKQNNEMPDKFDFSGISILLAEDDNINKLLIRRALESVNVKVLLASNGAEAVDAVKENKSIRLILMDIKMPVMDGIEATQLIKSIYPNIPIVAQTAYALPNERKDAIEAGCNAYLTKPINITMLYRTIQQLL